MATRVLVEINKQDIDELMDTSRSLCITLPSLISIILRIIVRKKILYDLLVNDIYEEILKQRREEIMSDVLQ